MVIKGHFSKYVGLFVEHVLPFDWSTRDPSGSHVGPFVNVFEYFGTLVDIGGGGFRSVASPIENPEVGKLREGGDSLT